MEWKAIAGLLKEIGINRPIWVYHHDSPLTFTSEDIIPTYRYGDGSDPIRLLLSEQHITLLTPSETRGKKRTAAECYPGDDVLSKS